MTTQELIDRHIRLIVISIFIITGVVLGWVEGDHLAFVLERALFMSIDKLDKITLLCS